MMVRSKYTSGENLLRIYNPSNSGIMIQKNGKAAMMSAETPSLTIVMHSFGGKVVSTFLSSFLIDAAKFFGLADKIDGFTINSIAESIMTEYYYLKISELTLFFHLLKSGHFRDRFGEDRSRMYGSFSGEIIMDCLFKFKQERAKYLDELEAMRKIQERDDMLKNAVPPPPGVINLVSSTITSIGHTGQRAKRTLNEMKSIDEKHITKFDPMSESEKIRRSNNNAEFYRMLEEQQRKQKLGL